MKCFFNLDLISELIEKLESDMISDLEHSYLQNIIASFMLIQQYYKERDENKEFILFKYYYWLNKNWRKKNLPPKIRTDYFLFQIEIEKYFSSFKLHFQENIPTQISHFERLQIIAQIWAHPLQRQRDSVLEFLSFFMQNAYEIPKKFVQAIFALLSSSWKPILAPIGAISHKKLSLKEIEEYFFGGVNKKYFTAHVIKNVDRLFSITNSKFENHLFLPKISDLDIFEAALVVHEFQHIQDTQKEKEKEDSLFISEKNALNAERVFMQVINAGKRGKFCWLESNLFYPILLLKWELEILLSDIKVNNIEIFNNICHNHGMGSLNLSSLFDWGAPFQMSAYCAAIMELEHDWKYYFRELEILK